MKTMTVEVEIDPWDAIEEIDEEELAQHLEHMGWCVSKDVMRAPLDKFEVDFLIGFLDTSNWEQRRIYDKLMQVRIH